MKHRRHKEFPAGRLVLLAPPDTFVPRRFENVECSNLRHAVLLAELQRLRGRLYLDDGAIGSEQLTPDGRHCFPGDERAWHILALDDRGAVAGCSRYLAHPNTIAFHNLTLRHSALAESDRWGALLRRAVCEDMERARQRGVAYAEAGGWALTPKLRRSREALRIALATYGLARVLGECIGITTATRRHCSSEILRRIGGRSLESSGSELPSYYDPRYGCEMEVLRFDSIQPNPRFEAWVNDLCAYWLTAPVIRIETNRQTYALPVRHAVPLARPTQAFEENLALAVQ